MVDTKILPQIGINSVYIIKTEGIPLIVRNYAETSIFTKDYVIISGFITAFNMFTESAMGAYISDLSLLGQRLFFKHQSEIVYIIAIDEQAFVNLSLQDCRHFIEELLWRMVSIFSDFFGEAEKKYKFRALEKELDAFSERVDELIVEGAQSWLETLSLMRKVNTAIVADLESLKVSHNLLQNSGLLNLFVLEENNLTYETNLAGEESTEEMNQTITNFYKTIQSFASNALVSAVNDIGLFSQRIHIGKFERRTIMVIVDQLRYLHYPITILNLIIEDLLIKLNKHLDGNSPLETFPSKVERMFYTSIEEIGFILSVSPF